MPAAEFFNQFGILTVRNFLDREVCLRLRAEMSAARLRKGFYNGVEIHTETAEADFKGPRVADELSAATVNLVETALLNQLPELEKHFQVKLNGIESVSFGVYKKGCGFKPHLDAAPNDGYGAGRKVSAVIFLNRETDSPQTDSYCGGNLTFYGLMKNQMFDKFGLPLAGEQGMLVAFPPNFLHAVTPVTAGERFVALGWYL